LKLHRTNAFVLAAIGAGLLAAQSGVQRTVVEKHDVSVPGRESVITRIEVAPGGSTGRHTHPGDENTYILEGQLEVTIDGEAPRTLKAGDAIVIPGGSVHNAKNTGAAPVKAVGVYVVEKGKPLASPVS